MNKYPRDNEKDDLFDFSKLEVGDIVFDGVDGPASPGGLYGIGEIVTAITDQFIVTHDSEGKISKWENKEPYMHVGPPTAYYLWFYQKGEKSPQ